MGSLQEQLLKSGLVSEDQLEQTRKKGKPQRGTNNGKNKRNVKAGSKPSRKTPVAKQARNKQSPATGDSVSLAQAYKVKEALERKERETDKQRQQRQQEERRLRNLKLEALVKDNIQNDGEADIRRYFEYAGRIRHLYVTQKQLDALAEGRLGIVVLRGRYLLLTPPLVEEFRQLAPDLVPAISAHEPVQKDTEDDVPSDLRW